MPDTVSGTLPPHFSAAPFSQDYQMRSPYVLIVAGLVFASGLTAGAAPPWQRIAAFKRVEANPDKTYPLTEKNGPWVILAVTFSGDEAADQANELVQELRSRYKMPAYTYELALDFSNRTSGRRSDQFGQPVRMKYRLEQMHEIAVMVGNYPTADDVEAQKVLKKLRQIQPDCLDSKKRAKEGKREYRTLASLREYQDKLNQAIDKNRKPRGPMRHAMLTTNPLMPDDYFVPKGVDPLVLKMNAPVKYSLLNCPGRYTCKIATFKGSVLIDQAKIKQVLEGKKLESRLEEAAAKAHEMTMALRAKGYEAYEFHDRYASMVTVGSFDTVGTPRPDGQIEIDPRLHKLITTFSAEKKVVPGQAAPKLGDPFIVRTKIGRIPCDIQAVPVLAPKRSIASQYARGSE
ncbi:MAG TPA: hypothetical protein VJ783_00995 [Pirellulales bacterium]|nr:hypothetical protein [Pirellulales bacterium]